VIPALAPEPWTMPAQDPTAGQLAHVRHHDHGGDFWRAVDRAMPGWEGRRARLKQAGSDLWLPS
jgi:hypothetical protein